MNKFLSDPRFAGIEPFKSKVWLSSPTMHGDEQKWVDEAIQTNWVSTVGANINEVEKQMAESVTVVLVDWNAVYHIGEQDYLWQKPLLFMIPVIPLIWFFAKSGGYYPMVIREPNSEVGRYERTALSCA